MVEYKELIMKNVLIINASQVFSHSNGLFNTNLTSWTNDVLSELGYAIRVVKIADSYDVNKEVENYNWADIIIYHTPIWWFQVPNRFKLYIDEVFTAGHNKGIYTSDGRSRSNPDINYGTGGLMHGKKYMVTTTWNAPEAAFTLANEFFDQKSVDDGVLFGFHKMNQFVGLTRMVGFHFHDLEKNVTDERVLAYRDTYMQHLINQFPKVN